jgi:hypothetical protein
MDKLDTELFMGTDHPPRLKSLTLNNNREKSYSSINTALRHTSEIAIAGLCTILLIACGPLVQHGGSSTADAFTQCSNGLPADLSGVCRNPAPTMGALEAVDSQVASAAAISITTTPLQDPGASVLNGWSLYQGTASGYFAYYGPTSDNTNLASNLPMMPGIMALLPLRLATSQRWTWA